MPRRIQLLRHLLLAALITLFVPSTHAMLEGSFLYFPSHEPNRSPLTKWTIDGEFAGYARVVQNPSAVWLILHGNAGQASNRAYIVERLPADTCAYVMEYPGYGQRPGKPSMKSINAAAARALETLSTLYPELPVGVFGESLGSGPASYLCSLPAPPARLVLAVPHDNLLSVAKQHIRFLPVGLLMRDKWDNVKTLSSYKGPVLIFGALHDNVIPVTHARALAASVPQARYVELPCGHNEWSLFDETRIRLD